MEADAGVKARVSLASNARLKPCSFSGIGVVVKKKRALQRLEPVHVRSLRRPEGLSPHRAVRSGDSDLLHPKSTNHRLYSVRFAGIDEEILNDDGQLSEIRSYRSDDVSRDDRFRAGTKRYADA